MLKRLSPQQHLIGSFALLILVGSVALMLPGMTTDAGISYVDALFTATSAVCVTGLVVKDTGGDFTRLGQWVILVLIQLGGLGIMTFSTIFLLILGRRPSLSQDTMLQGAFAHSPMRNLHTLILWVMSFTLIAELVGAACYFAHGVHESPVNEALFIALFHAVSAFCNAGFCLFADSFVRYQSNVLMNLNTIVLIVVGGIGFLVLLEVYERYGLNRGKNGGPRRPFSLHAKLTVLTTLILILAGALFFLVVEYHNVLRGMDFPGKILISVFQSVTARTAGFNTVDFSLLSNATLFFFMILMFIGASPGSCGGGIKTTTAAVFFALLRSRLRGESDTMVMNRTIPKGTAARTVAVVISAGLVITVMVVLLLVTQLGGTSHVESRGMFLEYLFEAVSAFGTVGLSMGKTAGLNTVGRLVIIMLMFIGRLGPLTLAFSIRAREIPVQLKYSEEHVMIG
jgi:trk system potassium uptake protein TrkH